MLSLSKHEAAGVVMQQGEVAVPAPRDLVLRQAQDEFAFVLTRRKAGARC
jgi:hypothetical protein